MNEPRNKQSTGQAQAASGAAGKAEKVRSSRYEWESKSEESGKSAASAKPSGKSLMATLGSWLKKLFSDSRGFFDNDDDASPSAA
jgi:hypothetical protein